MSEFTQHISKAIAFVRHPRQSIDNWINAPQDLKLREKRRKELKIAWLGLAGVALATACGSPVVRTIEGLVSTPVPITSPPQDTAVPTVATVQSNTPVAVNTEIPSTPEPI